MAICLAWTSHFAAPEIGNIKLNLWGALFLHFLVLTSKMVLRFRPIPDAYLKYIYGLHRPISITIFNILYLQYAGYLARKYALEYNILTSHRPDVT